MPHSSNATETTFSPSRRSLMFGALATGVGMAAATTTVATATEAAVETPSFKYPSPRGFSLALWGSSTIENAHVTQGVPAGLDAKLETSLKTLLGIDIFNFGRGGETSSNILARRGVGDARYRLAFPDNKIPASGTVKVTLDSSTTSTWNQNTIFPGYVQDIPGTLTAIKESEGAYYFTRSVDGEERYAPAGAASEFYSRQEMMSRASNHIIQIGRNNLNQLDQLKKDTKAAFDMAPKTTLVMGHFPAGKQAKDSENLKQVSAYNAWAAETYGDRFLDTMDWLREKSQESWLRYGDLQGSDVWNSPDDRKDYEDGNVPRSLYADDFFHLNGWGYLVLAQMMAARVSYLGWA